MKTPAILVSVVVLMLSNAVLAAEPAPKESAAPAVSADKGKTCDGKGDAPGCCKEGMGEECCHEGKHDSECCKDMAAKHDDGCCKEMAGRDDGSSCKDMAGKGDCGQGGGCPGHGQEHQNGFGFGWDLSSYSGDFSVGLRLASPRFLHQKLHVEASGGYAWAEGVLLGGSEETWAAYGIFRLGLFHSSMIGHLPLRYYGGGGVVLLLPTDKLSSQSTNWGGYGLTGLELFMWHKHRAWFVELGGMGTGAKANQLIGSPIYANGFTIAWGFRHYL